MLGPEIDLALLVKTEEQGQSNKQRQGKQMSTWCTDTLPIVYNFAPLSICISNLMGIKREEPIIYRNNPHSAYLNASANAHESKKEPK